VKSQAGNYFVITSRNRDERACTSVHPRSMIARAFCFSSKLEIRNWNHRKDHTLSARARFASDLRNDSRKRQCTYRDCRFRRYRHREKTRTGQIVRYPTDFSAPRGAADSFRAYRADTCQRRLLRSHTRRACYQRRAFCIHGEGKAIRCKSDSASGCSNREPVR